MSKWLALLIMVCMLFSTVEMGNFVGASSNQGDGASKSLSR